MFERMAEQFASLPADILITYPYYLKVTTWAYLSVPPLSIER
jgi:hypothetical protein